MVSVSCFGVRVSVMFHFMFVHYIFSSVFQFLFIAFLLLLLYKSGVYGGINHTDMFS